MVGGFFKAKGPLVPAQPAPPRQFWRGKRIWAAGSQRQAGCSRQFRRNSRRRNWPPNRVAAWTDHGLADVAVRGQFREAGPDLVRNGRKLDGELSRGDAARFGEHSGQDVDAARPHHPTSSAAMKNTASSTHSGRRRFVRRCVYHAKQRHIPDTSASRAQCTFALPTTRTRHFVGPMSPR